MEVSLEFLSGFISVYKKAYTKNHVLQRQTYQRL